MKRVLYRIISKKYYKGKLKNILIIKPIIISKNIKFSNNIFIRNNARMETLNKGQIIIGKNVNIEQNCHITSGKQIIIGSNTAILANVCITDINHPYKDICIAPKYTQIETKKTIIGDDCMICMNSVILAGTKLGNHCIVGANSVVKGEFPDNSVLAGSPAKIIKTYNKEKKEWIKVK